MNTSRNKMTVNFYRPLSSHNIHLYFQFEELNSYEGKITSLMTIRGLRLNDKHTCEVEINRFILT